MASAKFPTPNTLKNNLRHITAEPHMAGTEGSHRLADWLRLQYENDGFDAKIVSYSVWLPLPTEVKLDLVAPQKKPLATQEEPYEWDKSTYDSRASIGFNTYSPSGEVTATIVYANYGTADDYRQLESLGVSVAGKIVLVRYGNAYRGIKSKLAEEHKAAALLIYSDPADDGYDAGDVYPRGPWRPMSGNPTRLDPLHRNLSRRSSHARRRGHSRCAAHLARRCAQPSAHSRDAHQCAGCRGDPLAISPAQKFRAPGKAACPSPIIPAQASPPFI